MRSYTQTQVKHLWPGSFTHPMFVDKPPVWEFCHGANGENDCTRWEHKTYTREVTETEWKEVET